jgi:hypothetical protein
MQYGKLAENARLESLAERRPSSGPDAVVLETPVTLLVEQHLVRLTEDGRSPTTLATYRFAVGKLEKFIGGFGNPLFGLYRTMLNIVVGQGI